MMYYGIYIGALLFTMTAKYVRDIFITDECIYMYLCDDTYKFHVRP
jgi:hypothetical protein